MPVVDVVAVAGVEGRISEAEGKELGVSPNVSKSRSTSESSASFRVASANFSPNKVSSLGGFEDDVDDVDDVVVVLLERVSEVVMVGLGRVCELLRSLTSLISFLTVICAPMSLEGNMLREKSLLLRRRVSQEWDPS